MRTFIILAVMSLMLILQTTHASAKEAATCKYETADIGTIIGRGATADAAFEDAATKCFDRRAALYKARHGRDVAADPGELFIDVCVNIRCG